MPTADDSSGRQSARGTLRSVGAAGKSHRIISHEEVSLNCSPCYELSGCQLCHGPGRRCRWRRGWWRGRRRGGFVRESRLIGRPIRHFARLFIARIAGKLLWYDTGLGHYAWLTRQNARLERDAWFTRNIARLWHDAWFTRNTAGLGHDARIARYAAGFGYTAGRTPDTAGLGKQDSRLIRGVSRLAHGPGWSGTMLHHK